MSHSWSGRVLQSQPGPLETAVTGWQPALNSALAQFWDHTAQQGIAPGLEAVQPGKAVLHCLCSSTEGQSVEKVEGVVLVGGKEVGVA
jgi:hypothetical protein